MDDPSHDSTIPHDRSTSVLVFLGDALGDSDTSLDSVFVSLTSRFADTVDSLVALMMTVVVDDYPFTIASPRLSEGPIVTTISVPLTVSDTTSCLLILAASRTGAFAVFAHDAASELGVAEGIEHDVHLDAFDRPHTIDLADRSVVDHAIGVLLDRGDHASASEARSSLAADAERSNRSIAEAAQAIVAAAGRPTLDPAC